MFWLIFLPLSILHGTLLLVMIAYFQVWQLAYSDEHKPDPLCVVLCYFALPAVKMFGHYYVIMPHMTNDHANKYPLTCIRSRNDLVGAGPFLMLPLPVAFLMNCVSCVSLVWSVDLR